MFNKIKVIVLIALISITSNLYAQVEHFFYFGDAMNGVGNGNYIEQTANSANAHMISAPTSPELSEEWLNKIKQAASHGNKSIIIVENLIFQWRQIVLQENAERNLIRFKNLIGKYEEHILGFYLSDEPYHRNLNSSNTLSDDEVYHNLQEAALLIKKHFPNAIVWLTEAYPVVEPGIKYPSAVDWIGVNCYAAWSSCTEAALIRFYDNLQEGLKPHQRITFTLDGYWNREGFESDEVQKRLIERNAFFSGLRARYNPIAFVPFIYQSYDEGNGNRYGLEKMPQVDLYLRQLSNSILKGEDDSPPVAKCAPQEARITCTVDGNQQNISVNITSEGLPGDKTQSFEFLEKYRVNRLNVEWTCHQEKWKFSHPRGWCALQTTGESCSPQPARLLCTVDGQQGNLTVQVNASAEHGKHTTSYILPDGLRPRRMDVRWTCQDGKWIFSHPRGWCNLRQR